MAVEPASYKLWANTNRNGSTHPIYGQCWMFLLNPDKDGYGRLYDNGKTVKAHRLAYEVHYGKIPEELCVLHKCDNTSCVNPDHLFLGTIADNNDDSRIKNRRMHGELHNSTHLTVEDVLEIRKRYKKCHKQGLKATNKDSAESLAVEFNVSKSAIYRIVHYKTWRHVNES